MVADTLLKHFLSSENFNLLKNVKWKNEKPKDNSAYIPTKVEHYANILTHGLFVIPVTYLSIQLVSNSNSSAQRWASVIYGCALVGLFSVSTVFHIVACIGKPPKLKELLHRGDRAMIYLFIAGSYTPWLTLKYFPHGSFSQDLRWMIWILASVGIIYQQLFHEKYKLLETVFYVAIAVVPSLAVLFENPVEIAEKSGLWELQMGGLAYLLGVLFFKMDGKIPFAHAIWHLHVVLGTVIHYYAVKTYLVVSHNPI